MDRDLEKENLQRHMQFEGSIPEVMKRDERKKWREEDEFQAVVAGIEERKQFLDEMRAAGKAGEYEAVINGQVYPQTSISDPRP